MALVTTIVASNADGYVSGIFRIDISARKVKAWGYLQDEAPLYTMTRKSKHGDIAAMPFRDLAELIRTEGERRR